MSDTPLKTATRSKKGAQRPGPELFFGLVAALGVDVASVEQLLKEALRRVDYRGVTVKLSERIREVTAPEDLVEFPAKARTESYMAAGDAFRKRSEDLGAVALLGVNWVTRYRRLESKTKKVKLQPVPRAAFIFNSLKTPAEVRALRAIYGAGFFLIGAYAPREARKRQMTTRLAQSRFAFETTIDDEIQSEYLITRDEKDRQSKFGQNVRDTFALSDVFVDSTAAETLERELRRFIELVFGHDFYTPRHDESGMYFARGAALRSAEMGRQVGAAIYSDAHELLVVGTNEVPKAGGGQYCDPDDLGAAAYRDVELGVDASDSMKRQNLGEVIETLRTLGWLNADVASQTNNELLQTAESELSGTRIMNAIEFGRAVHAEMAAITEAARRGVPIAGGTLYTTTFPCHNCARHIVSVGIRRVVYVEPYAKSLAYQLHEDSIAIEIPAATAEGKAKVIFQPFLGVAPALYSPLFSMVKRKVDGRRVEWDASTATAKLVPAHVTYFDKEEAALVALPDSKAMDLPKIHGEDDD